MIGFATVEAAEAAVARWRRMTVRRPEWGSLMGWVIADADEGGYFARLGFTKRRSIEIAPPIPRTADMIAVVDAMRKASGL